MGEFESDELRKSKENSNKLKQGIESAFQEQERFVPMTKALGEMATISSAFSSVQLPTMLADEFKKGNLLSEAVKNYSSELNVIKNLAEPMGLAAIKMSSFYIDTSAFQTINSFSNIISSSLTTSIQSVLVNFSSALTTSISSPFIEWLRDIEFSPLVQILKNWDFDSELLDKSDELNEIYLRAMYDAKWFPYAGWIADIKLFAEVNDILGTSRGMSKRCEKRIDKAIISYYTKAEIKRIKKKWKESDLEPHIKKALGQTLEAYLRKEYALVIPFLATMWEGIIKAKGVENTKKPKEEIKKLVNENGYDDVFSDFYNNMIIGTCYSIDDIVEGVPNRHGVAHSWYNKYPNQKAALNAILLTDFLINLKQKKTLEENMDLLNDDREDKNNG